MVISIKLLQYPCAVYDGKLWIFAGYDDDARLNDMWTIASCYTDCTIPVPWLGCQLILLHSQYTVCLSIYLLIYLSMALQPFVGPWLLVQFLDLFHGLTPWVGDQPLAGQLHAHRMCTQKSMPQVWFKPTTPVFWVGEDSLCLRPRGHWLIISTLARTLYPKRQISDNQQIKTSQYNPIHNNHKSLYVLFTGWSCKAKHFIP
jgi:hypothetical protein